MITKRILVVDEEIDVGRSIKENMQNDSTDINCIASPSKALSFFMKNDYCLVIINNKLSGINDAEMIRIMRITKRVPILVLSAPLPPKGKIALFRAGANAIVEGPLNVDLCVAQAEALISLSLDGDRDCKNKDQVVFGSELIIIPCFRQVFIDGESLLLTRKEFDLLYYLASHPCQVFSLEQLYSHVWKDNFVEAGDKTVRTHIQTLRKKLAERGMDIICNVWGVGYKFKPPSN